MFENSHLDGQSEAYKTVQALLIKRVVNPLGSDIVSRDLINGDFGGRSFSLDSPDTDGGDQATVFSGELAGQSVEDMITEVKQIFANSTPMDLDALDLTNPDPVCVAVESTLRYLEDEYPTLLQQFNTEALNSYVMDRGQIPSPQTLHELMVLNLRKFCWRSTRNLSLTLTGANLFSWAQDL